MVDMAYWLREREEELPRLAGWEATVENGRAWEERRTT